MAVGLDETHDPARRSWVEEANAPDAAFPIQNLPLGVFSPPGATPRPGIAIGDRILDLAACADRDLLPGVDARLLASDRLNDLLGQGNTVLRTLRRRVGDLLDAKASRTEAATILYDAATCAMHLPVHVANYTDFYAGIHHARAAGALMTPDNPLPRNYKYVPIAYHGRPSSVRVSGGDIVRPNGQRVDGPDAVPEFGPCQRLDIELELGAFIANGNALGTPIGIAEAGEHVAGLCLLNDWSARDIQVWEMFPLGPFLGKNFSTSISPWIVTADALRPFRAPAMARPPGDPQPLAYLSDPGDQEAGGIDIELDVRLATPSMRREGMAAEIVIRSNARHLYWTPAQMVAHHSCGGCNLLPGDLIGTGTISGPTREQLSSFLELTGGGAHPFSLGNGEMRTYLQDGDTAELHGTCRRAGFVSIGFGSCSGTILPAPRI